MELNYWANVNLTYMALPHLLKSAEEQHHPKIIVVSSLAGTAHHYPLVLQEHVTDLVFPF